ncbi:hypothetical protein MATL_G00137200 [Megalops atlanticus]|uniref:SAM domain-containing protein n=1 Tax=Megalops atlanticus TaxID=7932 RepID=A0A9D3PSW8_MEGAT|nr:hypothetical protein MATL_G00137200 [Megalops atlanticus]
MQCSEGEREALQDQVPSATAQILMEWLERGTVNLRSPVNNETYQERLTRLEGDKKSLVLQVSVLTEQVETQGEKIRDLESSLDEHHHKLNSTEEILQQELLSWTSLETQKLDLMDEVSHLKLKLVGMEEEHSDGDNKQHKAECVVSLISELQEQMSKFQQEISTRIQEKKALEEQANASSEATQESTATGLGSSHIEDLCHCRGKNGLLQELRLLKNKVDELEGEKSQYEKKLKATKVEIADLEQLLATKDTEIECLQNQLSSRGPVSGDSAEKVFATDEVFKRRLKDKHQEMQRLRTRMETLLVANNEKDRRIEELRVLLNQYRRIKDFMAPTQVSGERILPGSSEEELSASLKMSSSGSSPLLMSPLSLQKELQSSCKSILLSPESMASPGDTGLQNGQWIQPRMLSSSLEELQSGSYQKHVVEEPVEPVVSAETLHIDGNKYQTLPGKLSRSNQNGGRETHSVPLQKDADESEDRNFSLNRCRSTGAPALGKTEKMGEATFSDLPLLASVGESEHQSTVSPDNRKNHKGIKKLWGKKTQSGTLQEDYLEPLEFRRGGLRATAGPRLAQTGSAIRDMSTPFSKWTKEQVCGWMEDYGLGQYVNLARQWVNNGQTLLSATPQDFEKEMGIRHPLHRKKLQLALQSFNTKVMEKSSELDHIWVTRWLDDIGLPQYKDQFNESRVDGRMIQYLTVNDLLFLKVTSQFHHLSIKCAIHVLHANKFNPHCLRRRPGDESKVSPSEVVQWSNHRVMEWLRSVDLAEYAPNLRGSGVHGGMIILEPRFNSDTLAMLLNIPPQKTLLRRHLATNFNTLVGPQAQQEKREFSESSGHAPLTTTTKVRPKKLGFSSFGHLRKKKLDDSTDYICPTEVSPLDLNVAVHPYSGFRGLSPILDRDAGRKDQVPRESSGACFSAPDKANMWIRETTL